MGFAYGKLMNDEMHEFFPAVWKVSRVSFPCFFPPSPHLFWGHTLWNYWYIDVVKSTMISFCRCFWYDAMNWLERIAFWRANYFCDPLVASKMAGWYHSEWRFGYRARYSVRTYSKIHSFLCRFGTKRNRWWFCSFFFSVRMIVRFFFSFSP